ncbi:tetratricopeptide repeat protein [Aliikangiella coralliicola]|uniref:Tetratricopeptide repeat protein n=1 Tax=Aliikangiella coralliicola TaxID=2592383 RepID=A0A545U8R2_9GAMM|nr:tetratricopeptide repeat protein [Aliikangiella coralliicola]TQV85859.1 tetratricopeptide repeat protein [Aliikangiella coralliicola]
MSNFFTNSVFRNALIFAVILLVTACQSSPVKRATLADIDTTGIIKSGKSVIPKSSDDIRKAYANYLKHASKQDDSRVVALNRLAELEFELSEQLLNKKKGDTFESLDDQLYNAKLDRTIDLLRTSLQDYPNAKNNDRTLYQLAKAYDQRGFNQETHSTIEQLVKQFPKSKYYIESQFRLAEDAFSSRQYTLAEDKYTEIIGSKKNNVFYEKALYKRGWSRFKQEYYLEAVDDFLQVVNYNQFDQYSKLDKNAQNLFNEYFRAIGLSFAYLGGAEPLNEYFEQLARDGQSFRHLYYTYVHVSDIFVKQGRYNDAVNTLKYFTQYNPSSSRVPEALLKAISIWKTSGFGSKMSSALESFYAQYHPASQYWRKDGTDLEVAKLVKDTLRTYILTVAANYHKQFQLTKSNGDFNNARRWYSNYLQHYSSYSHKDNIHYLFGTLLSENKNYPEALKHFELSAYDSDIIINKDAAYETITLASQLSQLSQNKQSVSTWLNKLIHFSTLYSQQYPGDKRTLKVIAHASELAYENEMYDKTIVLSELIEHDSESDLFLDINTIKAHSYFKIGQYPAAENTYLDILKTSDLKPKAKASSLEALALSIYYQGKNANEKNNYAEAIQHYARIVELVPQSETAATGLYDAIALAIKNELWTESISYIQQFRKLYPKHKHSVDIAKKLSVAYLNTKQSIAAAKELEKLSTREKSKEYQMAALFKAGELYQSKQDYQSAIRSYEKYAKTFTRPFPRYMESMYKLVELNSLRKNTKQVDRWRNKIMRVDKKARSSQKTDRTKLIASTTALELARKNNALFEKTRLVHPLKKNLKRKKRAMQRAVNLYARASADGIAETATEATHAIAEIYYNFSRALLESERPKNLNKDELEQYQILLEDQAFPFEEKAIEFYEVNLVHVKDDIYDQWVSESYSQLKKLFPVRYQRKPKLEGFINVLH